MNNKVVAIIVTYNPDIELLIRQTKSLEGQLGTLVVIDNCSKNVDQLNEVLHSLEAANAYEKIVLVKNDKNIGLGLAQNKGIEIALESDFSHVLIMDQDSVLDKNFVAGLLEDECLLLEAGQRVAAIGPVYYNEKNGEIYPITKFKGPFIDRRKPDQKPEEASFLISSGCLIRTAVLKDVGMMNGALFIDYIDVEWSFRAINKGYKLFATPKARMRHSIGDNRISVFGRTISVHNPLRRYYLCRNSIYMIRQPYIPLGYKMRESAFNFFRFVVFLVVSKQRVRYFKYSITGFWDGFLGRSGACLRKY